MQGYGRNMSHTPQVVNQFKDCMLPERQLHTFRETVRLMTLE